MTQRLFAVAATATTLGLPFACGGGVFTAAPPGGDASMEDGRVLDGFADALIDQSIPDGLAEAGAGDVVEEVPLHCGGAFQCIPAVPVGWSGPTDLYLGAAAAPACPGLSTDSFDGMEGLQAPAASCDCACGPPLVTCGGASLSTAIVKTCSPSCAITTPVLDTCFTAPADCVTTVPGATGTFQTLTVSVKSGSCSPQSTVGIPSVSWKSYARTCASPLGSAQGDCPTGQVCARTPSDPFQPVACIVQTGAKSCPADGYTQPHVEFTGLSDTRNCTACTCGAPANEECTGTLYAYAGTTNGTCGGMPDTYDPAVCVPTNSQSDMRVRAVGSGGACAASAGTPTGTATPTGTTTICCTE